MIWADRHDRTIGFVYLLALPLAAVTIAVFGYYDRQTVIRHNHTAIVLLAHTQCAENATFEAAALKSAPPAQAARIREFFAEFDRPINEALATLGEKPCPIKEEP